jgi:hypothetical protein
VEGKYFAIWGHGHWVKVKGHIDTNLLPDTPLSPDTSSHQIPIRLGDTEVREFRFQGHRVKVKGHIDTILSCDTPLSHDTSSHQISTKNLH